MNLEEQQGLPVSKQELKKIHESHIGVIWDAHKDEITDMEEFHKYVNKMAAAHSIMTLIAIDEELERRAAKLDSSKN